MKLVISCDYMEEQAAHTQSDSWVSTLTSFSELPRHLEATDEAEMLKKVVLHSVATARASRVLPVPGGPYSKMPYTIQAACTCQPLLQNLTGPT